MVAVRDTERAVRGTVVATLNQLINQQKEAITPMPQAELDRGGLKPILFVCCDNEHLEHRRYESILSEAETSAQRLRLKAAGFIANPTISGRAPHLQTTPTRASELFQLIYGASGGAGHESTLSESRR